MNSSPRDLRVGLPLRSNISWTFAGNVVYAACQWGMIIVLSRLGSVTMVGQFALGLAVTAPVILLANLQLRAVQATDARRQFQFADYLAVRLVTTFAALAVICVLALWSDYRWETSLVIIGIGCAKAFESISDVFYGILQQHERMDRVAKSMLLKGPISLVALALGTFVTGGVFGGVACLTVAWALLLFLYDVPSLSVLKIQVLSDDQSIALQSIIRRMHTQRQRLLRLMWLALPLGISMMLISLHTNIPRYFIELYLDERGLGLFAALAYLPTAGTTVISALGQSASPRLSQYYADHNWQAFSRLLLRLLMIAVLLGAAGLVVAISGGSYLLTLVYHAEYAEYTTVFNWLMTGAAIGYLASIFGYAMTATRSFRIQIPLFAVVAAILTILCVYSIPTTGLLGAAIAVVVGTLVQLVGNALVVIFALVKTAYLPEMDTTI